MCPYVPLCAPGLRASPSQELISRPASQNRSAPELKTVISKKYQWQTFTVIQVIHLVLHVFAKAPLCWQKVYISVHMGVSENSVPLHPMVLLIIIPIKWLFHWEYTLLSDNPISVHIPICWHFCSLCSNKSFLRRQLLWAQPEASDCLPSLATHFSVVKWVPSGNDLHSYWKWPFIVSFPMKNGDFP